MAEALRRELPCNVLLGVGAAFDFHSGCVRQAPRWMMQSGLEWFFRLTQEPRRLWRRYLILNPWFVWLFLLQRTGLRRFRLEDWPIPPGVQLRARALANSDAKSVRNRSAVKKAS
jgi:hypothetical protein